jgi:probable DNA repair protein
MDVFAALPAQLLELRVQQALDRGATVLTANQRAARTLRHAFDVHQRKRGVATWRPPAILSWEAWLRSLWHRLIVEGHSSALLLNSTQERALWREIIAGDPGTASLRPVEALAETAASAWLLLHAYQVAQRLAATADTSDTRAFARWARAFERLCRERDYRTEAELPEALRTAVAFGQLALPPEILLVGFDSKTPAEEALLQAIRTVGAHIEEFAPKLSGASPIVAANAINGHAELIACAWWLRELLTREPTARVAVVVPSIETERPAIDRVFRQVLAPECNDIATPAGAGPYEFSLGVPLAHIALVAAALDVLRWTVAPLALDRITALLLSPHFAPAGPGLHEHLTRAEFDAFSLHEKQSLVPEISLDAFADRAVTWRHASRLPSLTRHLRALQTAVRRGERGDAERTYAEWTAVISDLLEAAGWSQSNGSTSIEFQARRKWESALDELATLDFEGTRVSFAAALDAIERIAAQTLFAPESRHAPVQIMGPLEAAGSAFDAIWFVRANDLAWPAVAAANPLLPWRLQRDLAMPGADPARDFELAQRVTKRVAASAPSVVFSYAEQTAEGRQRISPALAGIAAQFRSAADIAPAPAELGPVTLDSIPDDAPVPSPPDRPLHGGASILKAQAACGFLAFAEQRLYSAAIEPATLGLDPRERGKLVHVVLEDFWRQVQTQATLKRMIRSDRNAALAQCIDDALAKYKSGPGWPDAYLNAERQRLMDLLGSWLDFEADQRSPFAVRSLEADLEGVRIGPLLLNVRVDRVDTSLFDGEPAGDIVLDYKTGTAKPADWLGERPDAPQLPLYAVVAQQAGDAQPLAAIAFASLRPGEEMGLAGYEAREGVLPKASRLASDSLDAQIAEWRDTLTSLAEDFYAGNAAVSPKRYPKTCEYCSQRLLCRLDAAALGPDALDPETFFDAESDLSDPDSGDLEAEFG